MTISRLMQMGAAGAGGEALAIEDVFSTYLYKGTGTNNSSTQTITNEIDLAGEGGLVWIKDRATKDHFLFDTERGALKYIRSNNTDSESSVSEDALSAFNSNGFTVTGDNNVNQNFATANPQGNYASWTFRKAPRFFDVVTYTGTGSTQAIAHNLGVAPGCIIVKRTDATGDWQVYHRSNTVAPETDYLVLNSTAATVDSNTRWNDTAPTGSAFTGGTDATVNASGGTYVAYLFAHDPLGPSGDGSDGLIACGSYTGNGSYDGPEINLGWEPQWILVKRTEASGNNWIIADNIRGWPNTLGITQLFPNLSNAEDTITNVPQSYPTATGFKVSSTGTNWNRSGSDYIYIAIRRGPMRAPESGTEVFAADTSLDAKPVQTTGFPVDLGFGRDKRSGQGNLFLDRLRGGGKWLDSTTTAAETTATGEFFSNFDSNTSWAFNLYSVATTDGKLLYAFRRAPGFFDVVAYTGDGVAGRTVPHNLGVAPEMMIVKARSITGSWSVYHSGTAVDPWTDALRLNLTDAAVDSAIYWNDTAPTSSVFSVRDNPVTNGSGTTYIAYLFATLPGVSKVGSYTGNGSSQTIDCGFTSGARFILIKRTDSTGDWYIWDTERGIVAANDPHLSLNTTAAEVTTDDSVDPDSSGFIVNQVAATNINVSSAEYIFYAIA